MAVMGYKHCHEVALKKMTKGFLGRSILRLFVVASITLLGAQSQAAEIYRFYQGVRALGMGGAYSAVVNDETSLLTNPAGLGKLRDRITTVADPEAQGSLTNFQVIKLDRLTFTTPSGLLSLLNEKKGVHWNAKAQLFPSIVAPNVGFGIHGKVQYDAEVAADGSNFRMDYTNDYAAVVGVCFRFLDGIIKFGFTGRYVDRTEIHKDLDPTVTDIDMSQTASSGTGLASDVGLILTAPVALLPALSLVLHDAGVTSYQMGSSSFLSTSTKPKDTPQTLDVGLAIFPVSGRNTRYTLTAEYHDAMNALNETYTMKKVHVGGEMNLADFFFIRAGMNQSYWTAGMEISSEYMQIQIASYGEEIGTEAAKREDRRFVAKVGFRF